MVDSVQFAESDSAFVAVPSALAVGVDGVIAVADGQRIMVFGHDGKLQQQIGRAGTGPGEFLSLSGVAFSGDSLLVVDDAGAQKIHLFRYPAGTYVRSVARGGTPITMTSSGGSVWLGILRNSNNTTVTEWPLTADTVRYHGTVPEAHRESERLRQVYGYVAVTATSDAIYYAMVSDSVVRRIDRQTNAVTTIPVPRRLRRGVPADLAVRLERTTAAEDYAGMLSSLVAINAPSRDTLQVVHLDVTVANDVITAEGFLTTLDLRTGSVCTDVSLGFTGDARPQVTFARDTVVVIDQAVVGEQGVTFARFLKSPRECK